MHELAKLIRRAALEVYENTRPTEIVCGKVKELSPLRIELEDGLPVRLMRRVNEPDLAENDEVYLLRQRGGQRFLILDKAVMA